MSGTTLNLNGQEDLTGAETGIYAPGYSVLRTPAYDSASMDYKNQLREAYVADADLLAVNELLLIQSRSRNVCRNNGIVTTAEKTYVRKLGSVKVVWVKKDGSSHAVMQELWDEFYANPMADGKGDGNVMQATWNHDRFQSGEAIARMIVKTKGNTNRVPLKIQNIESEYLDVTYMGWQDPELANLPYATTRYGITFDEYNAPIYYNFWTERHYGIKAALPNPWLRVKVPANEICHIFERTRSNQWRGIPLIAPILSDIYALTDLRDATVAKQAAAAAISWIIEQPQGMPLNNPGSVRTAGNTMPMDIQRKLFFLANGGQVQYTNPGEKFQLVQSADIGNNLIDLMKHVLQSIAGAIGIPYYILANDTNQLSFSAINGILVELAQTLEYIHHYINLPDGLFKITDRFRAIASLKFPVEDAIATYELPKKYSIDALKDYQGNILGIQSGQTTLKRVMSENRITEEELTQDIELRKKLGLNGLVDVPSGGSKDATKNNSEAKSNSVSV